MMLQQTELSLLTLYARMMGNNAPMKPGLDALSVIRQQNIESQKFFEMAREREQQRKNDLRDLKSRLDNFQYENRRRQQDLEDRWKAQGRQIKDTLRRQRERQRDLENFYKDFIASRQRSR